MLDIVYNLHMEIKYERCLFTKCSLHNKITKTPPTLIEGWSIGNCKSRDDTAHNVRRAFRKKDFGGGLSQPGLSQEHLSLYVAVTAKVQQSKAQRCDSYLQN